MPLKKGKKEEKDDGGNALLSAECAGNVGNTPVKPLCSGKGKHAFQKVASPSPYYFLEDGTPLPVPPSCGPATAKCEDVEEVLRQTIPKEDTSSPSTSSVTTLPSSFPVETKVKPHLGRSPQKAVQERGMKDTPRQSQPFVFLHHAPEAKDEETTVPQGTPMACKTARVPPTTPPAPRRVRKRKQRMERNLEKKVREYALQNATGQKTSLPVGDTAHTDGRGPPLPSTAAVTTEESRVLGYGRPPCNSAFPQGSGIGESSTNTCYSNPPSVAYMSPLPSSYPMASSTTPFAVPSATFHGTSPLYALPTPSSTSRPVPPFFLDVPEETGNEKRHAPSRQGRKRINLPRGSGVPGTPRMMLAGEFLPDCTHYPYAYTGYAPYGHCHSSHPHSVMFSAENGITLDETLQATSMDDAIAASSATGDNHFVPKKRKGTTMPPSTGKAPADPLDTIFTGMGGNLLETGKDHYAPVTTASPFFFSSAACVPAGVANASPLSPPLYRFASPFGVMPTSTAVVPAEQTSGNELEEKKKGSHPQGSETQEKNVGTPWTSRVDAGLGGAEEGKKGGSGSSLDAFEGLDADTRFCSMHPSFGGSSASPPLPSSFAPFFPSFGLDMTTGVYDGECYASMGGRAVEETIPFSTAASHFSRPFYYACPTATFVPSQDTTHLVRSVPPPSSFAFHPLHVDPSEARLEGRLPAVSTESPESSVLSFPFFSCHSTPPHGAPESTEKREAEELQKQSEKGSPTRRPSCSEDTRLPTTRSHAAFGVTETAVSKDDLTTTTTMIPTTAVTGSGESSPKSSCSSHGSTHDVPSSAAATPPYTWSVIEHPFPEHTSSSSLFSSTASQSNQTSKPSFAVHSLTPSSYSTPLSIPSVSEFPFRSFSLDPTNRVPVSVFSCSPTGSSSRSSGNTTHPNHHNTEHDHYASDTTPTGSLFSAPSAVYSSNMAAFSVPNYNPAMASRTCFPYKFTPTLIRLVNTMKELTNLCRMLLDHPQPISLDLEGRDLGRNGSLCIVTLATVNCTHLIDMVVLGSGALDPYPSDSGVMEEIPASHLHGTPSSSSNSSNTNGLSGGSYNLFRQVLESPYILKLMFDCRRDCEALYYCYRIRLRNVCDLQAAYCCAFRPAHKHLPSMQAVLTHLDLLSAAEKSIKERGKNCFSPEKGGSFQAWEERPLAPLLVHYCAVDVRHFFRTFYILKDYVDYAMNVSEERIERVCNGYDFKKMAVRDF